ncbi:hypothetical protein [Pseudomonas bubulae]|uniref:hypothetical protein n=1 Tax=Pseudomonas bubulae TaxID=2316085 RepID=UPI002B1D3A9B|nr:hypothetical protein [Pseudomonas bubulae]
MENALILARIKERLQKYTVEETIDRLHSYGSVGPTIKEYFDCGMDYEDFYNSDYSIPFIQKPELISMLIAANDEELCFELYDDSHVYDMAA